MTRTLLLLLLLATACGSGVKASPSSAAKGGDDGVYLSRLAVPAPEPHPRTSVPAGTPLRPVPTRASRSRVMVAPAATGSLLDVTMYCWTGARTASGAWPALGMAAGNRWPFGTRLRVVELDQVVTITDRIGHGSDLDLYGGRDGCEQRALTFGRQHLHVLEVAA